MDPRHAFFSRVEETIQQLVERKDRNPQKPVKQHFVPTSYQARFRGDDGLFWAYLLRTNRIHKSDPGRVGYLENLYTLPGAHGNLDYKVEHFFGVVEDKSAPAIEKLLRGEDIKEEERFWICFFWGAAFCRSHDLIRSYRALAGDLKIRELRRKYSSLEETRRWLEAELIEIQDVSAEELFERVHSDDYDIVYETHSVLPALLRLMPRICQILWDSRITALRAPEGKSFVTGDNPVVLMSLDKPGPTGFGKPHTAKVMPLSCEVCLVADGLGEGIRRRPADRDMVRRINLKIASDAQEFILGRSRALISSLVEATGARTRAWTSSFKVS
ncbi:DUF4238 domain-containing protein [Achromobacter sp. ESBL13]|uniref:DUF4238 domain-containing protein n=1 Tax=Achromobacter sp. ESBL13 TaxID=3077328 RepID=UPI002FCC24BD